MSFDTQESCHNNVTDYKECLEGAFNVSSQGIDQASDYQFAIILLTGTIILIAAAWIVMSIYNAWNAGNFKFPELITRIVRVIVITSMLTFLISP